MTRGLGTSILDSFLLHLMFEIIPGSSSFSHRGIFQDFLIFSHYRIMEFYYLIDENYKLLEYGRYRISLHIITDLLITEHALCERSVRKHSTIELWPYKRP